MQRTGSRICYLSLRERVFLTELLLDFIFQPVGRLIIGKSASDLNYSGKHNIFMLTRGSTVS